RRTDRCILLRSIQRSRSARKANTLSIHFFPHTANGLLAKNCRKMHRMKMLILMMVTLMTISALAKSNDWEKFNSSLLIEVTRPNGTFTCTGVALGKRLVVTAAHCLEGKVDKVRIFLSSYYDPKLPSLPISDFILH